MEINKLLLNCFIASLSLQFFSSCKSSDEDKETPMPTVYTKSWIRDYLYVDSIDSKIEENNNTISFYFNGPVRACDSLSTIYGDTCYNRYMSLEQRNTTLAESIASIDVTSENEFDSNHPSGTSLSDILTLEIATYADFIKNGYKRTEGEDVDFSIIKKRLADFKKDDYSLITLRSVVLSFSETPNLDKEHTFHFIVSFTNGMKKESVVKLKFNN